MNDEDKKIRDFALSIAKAESESEIENILSKYGFDDDNENVWESLGDGAGSVIDNQQSQAEGALVEKIINSVDAVLMKEAKDKYGDPCHRDAPSSIKKAVSEFFDVGDISDLETKETLRKKMPGNISVSITGSKKSLSVIVADQGEGQCPEDFSDTFARLIKSQKEKIQFVQGKFGMGGTGAFRFCGKFHYNLVISKKNIKNTKDNRWGVTVFRRLIMGGNDRVPRFVYLKPNGKILSFDADNLKIYPTEKGAYTGEMKAGTFVKMYEYGLKNKSDVKFDTYRTLSKLIPEIALPVNVFEHRDEFKKKTKIVLDGLRARLLKSAGDNEPEKGFPSFGTLNIEGVELHFEVFAFRDSSEIKQQYAKSEAVIFMNNGQNQGSVSKSDFFRNTDLQKAGFNYIKDDILILLYCDFLDKEQNRDIFLGNRETLAQSDLVNRIKTGLVQELANHDGLKELAQRRRQERLSKGQEDIANTVKEILPKILGQEIINDLLPIGAEVSSGDSGENIGSGKSRKKFEGKKHPTFFNIVGDKIKLLPINGKYALVTFKTDVENNYFDRKISRGKLSWIEDNSEKFDSSWNLWEGDLKIKLTPLKNKVSVGEKFRFTLNITDEIQKMPFSLEFEVHVESKRKQDKKTGEKGKKKKEKSEKSGGRGLPKFNIVRKERWEEHSFTEESAVKATSMSEGNYDYFINMDNRYLLREINKEPSDKSFHEAQYYLAMQLISLAIVGKKERELKSEGVGDYNRESIENFVKETTTAISCLIFPLMNELSRKDILKK